MFCQKEGTKCCIKNPTKRFKRRIEQNRQTGKVGGTWLQQDDPKAPRPRWCSPCRRHNFAKCKPPATIGPPPPLPKGQLCFRVGTPAVCSVGGQAADRWGSPARRSGVVVNAQVLSSQVWLTTTRRSQARGVLLEL